MSILNNSLLLGQEGSNQYRVQRSLRFNSSDSAFCSRVFSSAGNRTAWTFSCWVKRSTLGGRQVLFGAYGATSDTDWLEFGFGNDPGSGEATNCLYWTTANINGYSSAVFRDTSAWYHIVVSYNGSNLIAYVNASTVLTASRTGNLGVNGAWLHTIGRGPSGGIRYFDGYLAEIHFIDGQALTPSSFAETNATTGQWVPKAFSGSYGTNGFKLDFADNSAATAAALGKDTSGNNNHWTPNNLSINTGGPTSVAAASGALPIYNTTDTYGATKGTGTRTDANASSLVLAVPMDGVNNGTTFTDESATIKGSGSAKTITRGGDAKTSTAQSKFYGSSGYFDGTGDYLAFSGLESDYLSSDFTVEGWVNFSGANQGFFNASPHPTIALSLNRDGTGKSSLYIGNGTSWQLLDFRSSGALSSNQWHHVALVRSNSAITIYHNGIAQGTTSAVMPTGFTTTAYIGSMFSGSPLEGLTGYIQDFRIYRGLAKYTANFNPPSTTQNATVGAGCDSLVDTPTSYGTDTGVGGEVRGNYCTLNPLGQPSGTFSNGNLEYIGPGSWVAAPSTIILPSAGKYFAEAVLKAAPINSAFGGLYAMFGLIAPSAVASFNFNSATSFFVSDTGHYSNYNSGSSGTIGTFTTGTVIGLAVDRDTNQVTIYQDGVSKATVTLGVTAGTSLYFFSGSYSGSYGQMALNFGQRPFAYTAPSGFKALCDTNLPTPVVAKPNTVMDVKLYTGNGSTQTISGLGFSPDLAWIKSRTNPGSYYFHWLFDTIRGSNKGLASNDTMAEQTFTASLNAFDTSGFTVGSDMSQSTVPYAAWCWDAGSSTVTNTQGSITSSVRANASAGFSIVTYTGSGNSASTVGHGLGVAPPLVIAKSRTATDSWIVYTNIVDGSNDYLVLNSTAGKVDSSHSSPTATVFNPSLTMGPSVQCVAYCFAPVAGYSSFGSYTGNGSADGPFVYTGFRPRFLLFKRTDAGSANSWVMLDAARNAYNVVDNEIYANLSIAEGAFTWVDFLSNGFKFRQSNAAGNGNGATYIYCAWAESPFQYARAR